jgi:hypothetical protein
VQRSLASLSLFLFGLSVVFLILLTVVESRLAGIATMTERVLTFLLLVLPPGIGAVLGVMSLTQKEGKPWLGIIGIVLNTLFALFHLMIVLFAG